MLFQCYRYMFFACFLDSSRQLQHQSNAAGPLSVSVVAEQRRLFGHGSHAKRPRSSNSLSKSKRGATCTLKFVCLASKEEADRPPLSVKERTALANAGLGDASITFEINKSSVYNGIIERFPQLSEVGGFDVMLFQRGTGEDAGFHRINPPHTALRLKELCGQAKIYIRPLQKDIVDILLSTVLTLTPRILLISHTWKPCSSKKSSCSSVIS